MKSISWKFQFTEVGDPKRRLLVDVVHLLHYFRVVAVFGAGKTRSAAVMLAELLLLEDFFHTKWGWGNGSSFSFS